eukprot:117132-Chlamydomonas_euryale.AAC.13
MKPRKTTLLTTHQSRGGAHKLCIRCAPQWHGEKGNSTRQLSAPMPGVASGPAAAPPPPTTHTFSLLPTYLPTYLKCLTKHQRGLRPSCACLNKLRCHLNHGCAQASSSATSRHLAPPPQLAAAAHKPGPK